MSETRYTREELGQIEALIGEGLTSRAIAERLGRSEAGIRNLRYRKRLKTGIKALFRRRDELKNAVKELEGQHQVPIQLFRVSEGGKGKA